MNTQKKPTTFADTRKTLVNSPSPLSASPSAPQKTGGSGKEKFGYNKMWKAAKLMNLVWPVFLLLVILVLSIFVMGGLATFKWWMPLVVLGLIVWTVIEFRTYRRSLSFLVELSEEKVRVNGLESFWTDITKVEKRKILGNAFEIILYTNNNTSLIIPAQTDSPAYIKGFVDSHTKRLGNQ